MKKTGRKRRIPMLVVLGALIAGLFAFTSQPASAALTEEQCAELIEKGELARDDLAKLLEAVAEDPSLLEDDGGDGGDGGDDEFDIGTYLEQLNEDAAINIFGFVPPVIAGAPLDVCLPGGTTSLVLDGTLVLWDGNCTSDLCPVTVLIPAGIACTEHTMTAIGTDPETGEPFERTVTFLVAGDCSSGSTTTPLPVTGAQAGKMMIIAVGLVVLGGAALFGSRRRSIIA